MVTTSKATGAIVDQAAPWQLPVQPPASSPLSTKELSTMPVPLLEGSRPPGAVQTLTPMAIISMAIGQTVELAAL